MLIIRRDTTHTENTGVFVPGTEVARPDIEEEFLALLDDAVGLRLRSDIPVAAMVSGGLDSEFGRAARRSSNCRADADILAEVRRPGD